ncbi:MAG TPA: NUDIX hydrolase [Mycobacteriales bacterium]|nr:NUDIX hydrolase [Mycobacteriales bacterium]
MTHPLTDGDGWVRCDTGHQHWGRYGAAGLLLRTTDAAGGTRVLLQRRAWWTHHGDTWGVPGGARASWESPEQAALRELGEEVAVTLGTLTVDRIHDDDHGGWTYWTVLATTTSAPAASPRGHETAELRWVPLDEVAELPLHPGFARTWPAVHAG